MDAKLNHSDLSALLAKKAEISGAKAENITKAFFDIIIEGLEKDNLVKINGLGTFKVTDVASRGSVNVNTGEKIEIKGHKKLTFTPADTLKDGVNKPFAVFEPVEINDTYVEEENETAITADTADDSEEEKETAPATLAAEETEKSEPITSAADEERVAEEPQPTVESTPPAAIVAEEKTKSVKRGGRLKFLLTALLALALIALAAILFPSIKDKLTGNKNIVIAESTPQAPNTAVEKEAVVSDTVIIATDSTITAAPTPSEPYEFRMVDALAAKSVGSVNVGDTLHYKAQGFIELHTVAENETLTRIALKYYGDKRLWPYIVQYNSLNDPNGLCKGMELAIPRLVPVE